MSKKEKIIIPEELQKRVDESIAYGLAKRKHIKKRYFMLCSSMAFICILFVLGINYNAAFAKTVDDIPVLNQIAHIFNWGKHSESKPEYHTSITIPQLEETGYLNEKSINKQILFKIKQHEEKAKAQSEKDYQAYIETGGSKDTYIPANIIIDYEITCDNDDYLSFYITTSYTRAYSAQAIDHYNFNAKTGKELTLHDLLGDNYVSLITKEIQKQIAEQQDKEALYFDNISISSLIDEHRPFYIDETNHLIIQFDKYEIAAGAAGPQIFKMPFTLASGEHHE